MRDPKFKLQELDENQFRTLTHEEMEIVNGGKAMCSFMDDDDVAGKFSSFFSDDDTLQPEEEDDV